MDSKKYRELKLSFKTYETYENLRKEFEHQVNRYIVSESLINLAEVILIGEQILNNENFPIKEYRRSKVESSQA